MVTATPAVPHDERLSRARALEINTVIAAEADAAIRHLAARIPACVVVNELLASLPEDGTISRSEIETAVKARFDSDRRQITVALITYVLAHATGSEVKATLNDPGEPGGPASLTLDFVLPAQPSAAK